MSWLSIILWLVTNLPDLIALILRLFKRTRALAPIATDGLRAELSAVIQSPALTRKQKREHARDLLQREAATW